MAKVQICDWCAVDSGRTHGQRKCCILRRLASAPRHLQAQYASTLTADERDELRPRLLAEMQRLKALGEPPDPPAPD